MKNLLLLLVLFVCAGCGSLMCHYNTDSKYNFCGDYSGVYRSTRYDVVGFYEFPLYIPAFIIDLPFALVVDSLLLPYDLGVVIKDSYNQSKWEQLQEKKLKSTLEAMNKTTFSCPDGAMPKIKEWSGLSYSRYCVSEKLKDGPWEVWRSQYLEIKGSYTRGLKHGEWVWFNEDGSKRQIAQYSEGKILNMKRHTSKGWEHIPHYNNDMRQKPEADE